MQRERPASGARYPPFCDWMVGAADGGGQFGGIRAPPGRAGLLQQRRQFGDARPAIRARAQRGADVADGRQTALADRIAQCSRADAKAHANRLVARLAAVGGARRQNGDALLCGKPFAEQRDEFFTRRQIGDGFGQEEAGFQSPVEESGVAKDRPLRVGIADELGRLRNLHPFAQIALRSDDLSQRPPSRELEGPSAAQRRPGPIDALGKRAAGARAPHQQTAPQSRQRLDAHRAALEIGLPGNRVCFPGDKPVDGT